MNPHRNWSIQGFGSGATPEVDSDGNGLRIGLRFVAAAEQTGVRGQFSALCDATLANANALISAHAV
jgi:hypothetical protein